MDNYCYELKDSLYLNITNRCNNACVFCIKYKTRKFEDKYELWLKKEPQLEDILNCIENLQKYRQVVFCGYGEPLIRLELVKTVATKLKEQSAQIRINTDGLANLFYGRNILPELKGIIDEIYISLNADNPEIYKKICRPIFGDRAFPAIIEFTKLAKKIIPSVTLTAVDLPTINKVKCEKIANDLGVNFILRPYYEKTYKTNQ